MGEEKTRHSLRTCEIGLRQEMENSGQHEGSGDREQGFGYVLVESPPVSAP